MRLCSRCCRLWDAGQPHELQQAAACPLESRLTRRLAAARAARCSPLQGSRTAAWQFLHNCHCRPYSCAGVGSERKLLELQASRQLSDGANPSLLCCAQDMASGAGRAGQLLRPQVGTWWLERQFGFVDALTPAYM